MQNIAVDVAVNIYDYGSTGSERAAILGADDGSTLRIFGYDSYASTTYYFYRIGSAYYVTTTPLKPAGEWHTFTIASYSSGTKFFVDYVEVKSITNVISVSRILIGSLWNDDQSCIAYFDALRIRKYVYPEPSHAGWGSEELNPVLSWRQEGIDFIESKFKSW